MFWKKLVLIVTTSLTLSACVGMSARTQHDSSSSLVEYLYPAGDQVDHSADEIPQLSLPLKVGIAFVPEEHSAKPSILTEAKRQQLLENVSREFSERPYIQDIQVIPSIYMQQKKGFSGLQQVARIYGVDVIALVSFDQVSIRTDNWASFSYLTIVGAFLVPGENTEAQTFVDTAVFDVTSKRLLFRAPGSNVIDKIHTGIGSNKGIRDMKLKSFDKASEQMTENLKIALDKFKDEAKQGTKVSVSFKKGYSGGAIHWFPLVLIMSYIVIRRRKCK